MATTDARAASPEEDAEEPSSSEEDAPPLAGRARSGKSVARRSTVQAWNDAEDATLAALVADLQ